jgi:hypothetical protein
MITLTFFGILMLAIAVSLVDWRRGWILGILCGVLQDPARKLTPGTPVEMNFSVLLVYLVILFAAQRTLLRSRADIARRYPALTAAFGLILFCLALAAVNGVFTYGVEYWKVPALSLFIYLLPIPAVIIGYTYMRREEDLFAFFRYYSVLTCIAMIGTPLEYFRVNWRALGIVALPEGFIRYVPGLQIRILAGFYRAGDIMAWHAAMLTIIGITMSFRAGMIRKAWPWALVAGWGFLNCVISGRRKAIYMVVVYVTVFLWRYIRRLAFGQVVAFAAVAIVMFGVVQKIGGNEEASVYTRGATTTKDEVFERLEGGLRGTIEQFGFMGAGLGTATQGVRHLLGHDNNIGWQEGGLGKLAIELGVPGLLASSISAGSSSGC